MRALLTAALLVLLAGCGGGGSDALAGYTKLGTVDGVPVYVEVSKDGFTVNTKLVDDELACEGSTALNPDGFTELCNTQTKDTYVYAVAFPKADKTPRFCNGRDYAKVSGEKRLKGKKDWPFDVVAAVGHEPIFLTICLEDQLGVTATPTP